MVFHHPTRTRPTARPGFSLVELLIVIGIIGVLLGLLLPAVQAARESGRRSECGNRLRGIALAVRSYEQRFNRFPPSNTVEPGPRYGLIPFLLQDLEQVGVSGAFDFEASWNDARNAKAIDCDIAQLVCPETPEARQQVTDYIPAPAVGSTLYEPLLAKGLIDRQKQWLSMLQPSVRFVNSASVKDGLSKSFMLFEAAGRPGLYKDGRRLNGAHDGAHWASDGSATVVRRVCNESQLANCENIQGIYSFHSDGCNYAYGDASVRFLEASIEARIWIAAFTMAGN